MNNITKLVCLVCSLGSICVAEDSKVSSVRFDSSENTEIVSYDALSAFMGSCNTETLVAPSLSSLGVIEIEQIGRLYQLISRGAANGKTKRMKYRFVAENIEFPRLFWSDDLIAFLKSKSQEAPSRSQKEFVRTDIQTRSTTIVYRESRLSCFATNIPILDFLATQPNIVAWYERAEPNTVEGTNALPKTTVSYAFYEIPVYLSVILNKYYPVLYPYIDSLIKELALNPLSGTDIANRMGRNSTWVDIKSLALDKKPKFVISGIFTQHDPEKDSLSYTKTLAKLFWKSLRQFKQVVDVQSDLTAASSSSSATALQAETEGQEKVRRRRKSSITKKKAGE